jgi:murein DD-endopeptidase MepM/ murein hydrolase activator NlpD
MKLSQPWPEGFNINARSPYGWRVHPITGRRKFHHGVDVALPVGTPLTAPADGVVVKKGNGPSGGVTLILKHEDNRHTVYYHLQKPSHLAKGATVKRGDLIAYSGNTGASTGPHLHFEVRKSARWGDTVDPMPYLQAEDIVEPVIEPEPVPAPVKPPRIPKPLTPKLQAFFNMKRNLKSHD